MWYFGRRRMDKKNHHILIKKKSLKMCSSSTTGGGILTEVRAEINYFAQQERIGFDPPSPNYFCLHCEIKTLLQTQIPDHGTNFVIYSLDDKRSCLLGSILVLFALCRELCSSASSPPPPPSSPSNLFHVKSSVLGSLEIMPQYRGYWEISILCGLDPKVYLDPLYWLVHQHSHRINCSSFYP